MERSQNLAEFEKKLKGSFLKSAAKMFFIFAITLGVSAGVGLAIALSI